MSATLSYCNFCVFWVGVIDNKRLFVVQSRGELREGGERQVFLLEQYDDDDNTVRIIVLIKMMKI